MMEKHAYENFILSLISNIHTFTRATRELKSESHYEGKFNHYSVQPHLPYHNQHSLQSEDKLTSEKAGTQAHLTSFGTAATLLE